MQGLLYYLPEGDRSVTREKLIEAGLGHITGNYTACGSNTGPDGDSGAVVADSARVSEMGYYPDRQTWIKAAGPGYWVGFYTDDKPTPDTMARASLLPGHRVRLADDNEWLIPVARGYNDGPEPGGFCALPQRVAINDKGVWVTSGVDDRHVAIWQRAQDFWGALTSVDTDDGNLVYVYPAIYDAAADAVAANYALTKWDISALGLFDEQVVHEVCKALVDWNTMEKWSKKNEAIDGLSTVDGPAATTNDTAQL